MVFRVGSDCCTCASPGSPQSGLTTSGRDEEVQQAENLRPAPKSPVLGDGLSGRMPRPLPRRAAELFEQGVPNVLTADQSGVSESPVDLWKARWEEGGAEALRSAGRLIVRSPTFMRVHRHPTGTRVRGQCHLRGLPRSRCTRRRRRASIAQRLGRPHSGGWDNALFSGSRATKSRRSTSAST